MDEYLINASPIVLGENLFNFLNSCLLLFETSFLLVLGLVVVLLSTIYSLSMAYWCALTCKNRAAKQHVVNCMELLARDCESIKIWIPLLWKQFQEPKVLNVAETRKAVDQALEGNKEAEKWYGSRTNVLNRAEERTGMPLPAYNIK